MKPERGRLGEETAASSPPSSEWGLLGPFLGLLSPPSLPFLAPTFGNPPLGSALRSPRPPNPPPRLPSPPPHPPPLLSPLPRSADLRRQRALVPVRICSLYAGATAERGGCRHGGACVCDLAASLARTRERCDRARGGRMPSRARRMPGGARTRWVSAAPRAAWRRRGTGALGEGGSPSPSPLVPRPQDLALLTDLRPAALRARAARGMPLGPVLGRSRGRAAACSFPRVLEKGKKIESHVRGVAARVARRFAACAPGPAWCPSARCARACARAAERSVCAYGGDACGLCHG